MSRSPVFNHARTGCHRGHSRKQDRVRCGFRNHQRWRLYDLRHASLFRAVSYLSRQNQAHDALSVSHHLAKHGRLECIGGDAYIGDIVRSTHYAGESSIEARALQVRNLSSGRRLIASCQKIISMVESPTDRQRWTIRLIRLSRSSCRFVTARRVKTRWGRSPSRTC